MPSPYRDRQLYVAVVVKKESGMRIGSFDIAMKDATTSPSLAHNKSRAPRQGIYSLRIMVSLVASLLLMLAISHAPFYRHPGRVGWNFTHPDQTITLNDFEVEKTLKAIAPSGMPITQFGISEDPQQKTVDIRLDETAPRAKDESADGSRLPDIPLEKMALAFAEVMPRIQGGLGAFYLNIKYPSAAIEAGIEGRLILDFIVLPNGQATSIRLIKSLHPLCDSAAVRALRETLFMPGRQNGENVPVRMRLPVLFRLVDKSPTHSPDSTSLSKTDRS